MFSGIEAASVAWKPLGWDCQFVAEIEPFPSAVLAHHYPDVPNLGDVTKVDWDEIRTTRPVDLLVFGSPCQSFSVAGKRLGLDDPRGNLALYALAVVNKLRPRWFVFENVPGLLSSGGGRDFGQFLATVGECGYQCAWRILDAQYVRVESHSRAVPQRRRRVFVVGYLGDWRRAAAVLFERESLLGHPAPRRETGKGIAPTLSARTKGGGGLGTDFDCDGGLVSHSLRGEGFDASEDGTGRGTSLGYDVSTGTAGTLSVGQTPAIAFDLQQITSNANRSQVAAGLPAPTMAKHSDMHVATEYAVRRLIPLECERLQGFPDRYTDIEFRAKRAADGNRFKALGNSMAVNVMRWIGDRIQMIENLTNKDAA